MIRSSTSLKSDWNRQRSSDCERCPNSLCRNRDLAAVRVGMPCYASGWHPAPFCNVLSNRLLNLRNNG